jgi:hypothetical protein
LIAVFIVLVHPRVVLAQTGAALLLNPLLSEQEKVEGRADALFFNDGQTDHDNDFGLSIYQTTGRVRERRENFIPRIGWDATYLDLDTHEPGLPGQLLDASVGIGVDINTFKGWRGGLALGLGYAGDIPFNQGDAWYGKGTLVFGKDLDKQTTLAFVLDYDGSRSIFPDFPVPGFAYRYQFDPHLSYTVGIPVNNIVWKPSEVPGLRVDVSWIFVETFEAHVDYEVVRHLVVFGQLNTINRAFHTEQIEGNNRLLFFQRRAELGLRFQPREDTTLTGAIGYAWGGEFSAGFDTRDADAVADVSDEPYIRFGFETRF